MPSVVLSAVAALVVALLALASVQADFTRQYANKLEFSGGKLEWNYLPASNQLQLGLEADDAAPGWMGLGFSNGNGSGNAMLDGDLTILWMNASNNVVNALDTNTLGFTSHGPPNIDASQDTQAIAGGRVANTLSVEWNRPINSTDSAGDLSWAGNRILIFAMRSSTPQPSNTSLSFGMIHSRTEVLDGNFSFAQSSGGNGGGKSNGASAAAAQVSLMGALAAAAAVVAAVAAAV